jgi:cytochrome c551
MSRKARGLIVITGLIISSCGYGTKGGDSVKFKQYYVEGERLYGVHCSNCHQRTGEGLGLIYPPLHESDYMIENQEEVICLIKTGKSGELIVNGKSFNQPMPGIPTLTDLEIAEIATYIYNTWSHDKGLIDVSYVSRALDQCADR